MKIAVIGPSDMRGVFPPLLTRYADSVCADIEITFANQLTELPQESWQLAFIYAIEDAYESYLDFLSDYPDCNVVIWAEDSHLASSALRNQPCGFLVLPIDEDQFVRVMKRCHNWTDALRIINFSRLGSGRRVRCVEVQYVESFGHSCTVHCQDEVFTVNCTLTAMHQQLGAGFFRCHRGFIVNLRCVARVGDKSVFLQDGSELPLSPSQAESIAAEIGTYTQECAPLVFGGVTL